MTWTSGYGHIISGRERLREPQSTRIRPVKTFLKLDRRSDMYRPKEPIYHRLYRCWTGQEFSIRRTQSLPDRFRFTRDEGSIKSWNMTGKTYGLKHLTHRDKSSIFGNYLDVKPLWKDTEGWRLRGITVDRCRRTVDFVACHRGSGHISLGRARSQLRLCPDGEPFNRFQKLDNLRRCLRRRNNYRRPCVQNLGSFDNFQ